MSDFYTSANDAMTANVGTMAEVIARFEKLTRWMEAPIAAIVVPIRLKVEFFRQLNTQDKPPDVEPCPPALWSVAGIRVEFYRGAVERMEFVTDYWKRGQRVAEFDENGLRELDEMQEVTT